VLHSVLSSTKQRSDMILVARPSIGHTRLTHKRGPLVCTVVHLLSVSDILVKSLSFDEQPQVAHRNDGSFTILYEFNVTRPAHCDYNHPHTYLLTHSMQYSPSWEANWFCS